MTKKKTPHNKPAQAQALTPDVINARLEAINARQAALNEQARAQKARLEAAQQAYEREQQTLQTEFTENIGALKVLQSLLHQEGAEKS